MPDEIEFEDRKPYSLEELLQKLEDIRIDKDCEVNIASAFYTLANEIISIKHQLRKGI